MTPIVRIKCYKNDASQRMTDAATNSPAGTDATQALEAAASWHPAPGSADADFFGHLQTHAACLGESSLPVRARLDLLTRLGQLLQSAHMPLLQMIKAHALPLPFLLRTTLRQACDAHAAIAIGALSINKALQVTGMDLPPGQLLFFAARCFQAEIELSSNANSPPPPGAWLDLHGLFQSACLHGNERAPLGPQGESIEQVYLQCLLLGAAGGDAYSASESQALIDFIHRHADLAVRSDRFPEEYGDAVFWIEATRDIGPNARLRLPPPKRGQIVMIDCAPVAESARRSLLNSADPTQIAALERAAKRWHTPGKREFPRRMRNEHVTLCTGLDNAHRLLAGAEPETCSTWMLTNEAPQGLALMHVAGRTDDVRAGELVAICSESDPQWRLCIVRRALSDNPEHLELGLQRLASQASAINLCQPGQPDQAPLAGILLPPMPGRYDGERLVLPAGTTSAANGINSWIAVLANQASVREFSPLRVEEHCATFEVVTVETPAG